MSAVGYAYLQESLGLSAFPLRCPARVRAVTRISRIGDCLAVPQGVAPCPGEPITQTQPVRGGCVPLFDPAHYLTGPAVRNSRWRVDFNGLGSLEYCATVERTPGIETLLAHDTLGAHAPLSSHCSR